MLVSFIKKSWEVCTKQKSWLELYWKRNPSDKYVVYRKTSYFAWAERGKRYLKRILSLFLSYQKENPFQKLLQILEPGLVTIPLTWTGTTSNLHGLQQSESLFCEILTENNLRKEEFLKLNEADPKKFFSVTIKKKRQLFPLAGWQRNWTWKALVMWVSF